MAEELKASIVAQGEKIRVLKGQGVDKTALAPEVASLTQLKKDFKALTGSDYDQAPSAVGKKEKQPPQPKPAREGPSKKQLKKASKAAKSQSPEPPAAPAAAAAAAAAPAAGAAAAAAANCDLCLYAEDALAAQQVLMAAALAGAAVAPALSHPAPHLTFAGSCVLVVKKSELVFGTSAACRYFMYTADAAGDAAAESATAWAQAQVQGGGGALLAALEARLGSQEGGFLAGSAASVADAIAAPAAQAALSADAAAAAAHPRAAAYAAAVAALPQLAGVAEQAAALVAACRGGGSSGGGGGAGSADVAGQGLLGSIRGLFTAAISKAFPELGHVEAALGKCAQYKHGDFQCNSPMSLYPLLKARGGGGVAKPHDVARAIIAALPPSPLVESTSVAGPGFINVRLRPTFISDAVRALARDGPAPPPLPANRKLKIAVDFSSPNIAKEMHVGHLRSTIIGDTICRILEFAGHAVLRVNHVGDWGTQFGMLINHMKTAYPDFLTHPPNLTDLTTFYKGAKQAFDESEEFKDVSRKTVVKLQSGDAECLQVWKLLCEISRGEFQKVYDRLGVRLEECGESFYNKMIPGTLDKMEAKGLLKMNEKGLLKVEGGATVCMLDGFTYPLIVRKSDGGYGYDSTDMTAVDYRLNTLGCDWVIYVTDAGQRSHFDMVFERSHFDMVFELLGVDDPVADRDRGAAKACGWLQDASAQRLEHVGFGVVQGEDGKRFKSRSGDTVRLVDLLDEAVKRMHATLVERVASGKSPLSPEKVDEAAAAIGYGAVKYFDLRQHPATNYVFSYDRMLDTRGNTAVYLQFAHARLCSILRKAADEQGARVPDLLASGVPITLAHDAERALAFELMQARGAVANACRPLTIEHNSRACVVLRLDDTGAQRSARSGVELTRLQPRKLQCVYFTDVVEAASAHPQPRDKHASLDFTDVVQDFLRDLLPNRLCEYLYQLSTRFTDFVTNCHVLHSAERDSRLLLCEATGAVMRKVMELLGLTPLYQI
ncbi:Arginyl-tRNA synthetase [Tribonema minus]|uniref:arginine--tRNA ligase n=1 Tax=Tribonema minus TaxID=303371 RepID=A0A835ZA36_9STRA|nr:Arginyl-tRNA synthetase [Tribonema minus]